MYPSHRCPSEVKVELSVINDSHICNRIAAILLGHAQILYIAAYESTDLSIKFYQEEQSVDMHSSWMM